MTPTVQEEIDRKTLETLQKLVSDRANGRANEAQFAYGVDLVWSMAAGLVSKDTMLLIEMTENEKVRDDSIFTTRVFIDWNSHVVRLDNMGDGRVRVSAGTLGQYESEKFFDLREQGNPTLAAKQKFQQIADTLNERGYNQL